jgi:hypothetical protein
VKLHQRIRNGWQDTGGEKDKGFQREHTENAQLGQVAQPSTNCIVAPHCGHSEEELLSFLGFSFLACCEETFFL